MHRKSFLLASSLCVLTVVSPCQQSFAQALIRPNAGAANVTLGDDIIPLGGPLPTSILGRVAYSKNATKASALTQKPHKASRLHTVAGDTTTTKTADEDDTSFRPAAPDHPKPDSSNLSESPVVFSGSSTGSPSLSGQTDIGGNSDGERAAPISRDGRPMQPMGGDNEDEKAEAEEVMRNLLPPPDLIRTGKKQQAIIQRTDADPAESAYKPVVRTISLSLKPGEEPPIIHLHYGVQTSLTFSSQRGTPWYVRKALTDKSAYVSEGDAGSDDTTKTNIVTLSPTKHFSNGRNLTVYLEHCAIPLIFQLETGYSDNVDYRVDVSLLKSQPGDKPDYTAEQGVAPMEDSDLQPFVNGGPPKGAKALKTSDPSVEVWRLGQKMYVRSEMPVMSPRPLSATHGTLSGVNVYKFKMTPNVIISVDGELKSVMIGN
mgnify:CR=1 FL=1